MALFGTASGKQINEFAVALARELAEQCPPVVGEGGGRPAVPPRKLAAALDEVCRKALDFKNRHKLGWYNKARLGNGFRWELTDLGYDKRFAEDVTQRLVVQISRR